MWFGRAPVINPTTGKPKLTVPGNWLLPPLREYTFLLVGLVLGLLLGRC